MLPAYRYISALYKAASAMKHANALMGGQDAMPTAEGGPPASAGMPEQGVAPGQSQGAQLPPEVLELAKAIMQQHPECDPEYAIQLALQQFTQMQGQQEGSPATGATQPAPMPEAKLGSVLAALVHAAQVKRASDGWPTIQSPPKPSKLVGHEPPANPQPMPPPNADKVAAYQAIHPKGGKPHLRKMPENHRRLSGPLARIRDRLKKHEAKETPEDEKKESPAHQKMEECLGVEKHKRDGSEKKSSLSPMVAGFVYNFLKESAEGSGEMEKVAWTGMPRQAMCNIAEELDRVANLVNHYPGGQFEGSMSVDYMMGKLSGSDRVATDKSALDKIGQFNKARPMLTKKKKH